MVTAFFNGVTGFHLFFAFMFILVGSCENSIKAILPNQIKIRDYIVVILQCDSKDSWETSKLFEDWKLVKKRD